jgi:hypothetical protein
MVHWVLASSEQAPRLPTIAAWTVLVQEFIRMRAEAKARKDFAASDRYSRSSSHGVGHRPEGHQRRHHMGTRIVK